VNAGEKLLGNLYSQFMKYSLKSSMLEDATNRFHDFYNDSNKNSTTIKLLRISESKYGTGIVNLTINSKDIFFYYRGLRWTEPHRDFLLAARLGPGDVMLASAEQILIIPEGPRVPNYIFKHGNILRWRNDTYLIRDGTRRKYLKVGEHIVSSSIAIEDENPWIQMISQDADIPEMFEDGTLLRQDGAREVFLVRNGTRHSIPSLQKFMALGRDFSEVKVVSWSDLNQVPLGDSV
jgi:hypothetical protein